MRLFERALRRSGLPLKLSEGFNPRPHLSFPMALALGVRSRAEILEVELTEWVSPRQAGLRLQGQLPGGIAITGAQSVQYGEKAEVAASEYSVKMGAVPPDFGARLEGFMSSRSAVVERSTKSGAKQVNVREFVKSARLDGGTLSLVLGVSPAGSVRPEEVLEGIMQGPIGALAPLEVTRIRLDLSSPP